MAEEKNKQEEEQLQEEKLDEVSGGIKWPLFSSNTH